MLMENNSLFVYCVSEYSYYAKSYFVLWCSQTPVRPSWLLTAFSAFLLPAGRDWGLRVQQLTEFQASAAAGTLLTHTGSSAREREALLLLLQVSENINITNILPHYLQPISITNYNLTTHCAVFFSETARKDKQHTTPPHHTHLHHHLC